MYASYILSRSEDRELCLYPDVLTLSRVRELCSPLEVSKQVALREPLSKLKIQNGVVMQHYGRRTSKGLDVATPQWFKINSWAGLDEGCNELQKYENVPWRRDEQKFFEKLKLYARSPHRSLQTRTLLYRSII